MFDWLKRRAAPQAGLFGKIPAQGDFVRVHASDPAVAALDLWLQEAIEKSRSTAGAVLPSQPVRFLFRGAQPKQRALIGAMCASRDSVGREFPLSIFLLRDPARLVREYPRIPVALEDFFVEAIEILRASPSLELSELTNRIDKLSSAFGEDENEESGEPETDAMMSAIRSADEWARLFGSPGAPARYYAFRTFVSACRSVQKEDPTKSGATLDCPITSRDDVQFWLSLSQSLLDWRRSPPAFFWSDGTEPKLLLSLGPPPSLALSYLLRPGLDVPKFWPLKTADVTVREAAKADFDEAQQKVIEEDGASNGAVIASLARERG